MSDITVFTANRIITMNPSWPTGTAIAVRNGRILEVGTPASLKPWLDGADYKIDNRFAAYTIMPGFIDPHLHPSMAAVILPMRFITAMEWELPWERVRPVTTAEGFFARLAALDRETPPGEPLLTWGYHHLWHGDMSRAAINRVARERPIVVWHRSFHELYLNDGALAWLGITEADAGSRHQVDYDNGHFYENGLGYAISKLNPFILAPDRYREGLERLKRVAHFGGHTSLGDMAVGLFDFDLEWESATAVLDTDDTPFRTVLVPSAMQAMAAQGGHDQALEFMTTLPARNTHRLTFGRRVKLFTDGAFFSQLAQLQAPGYIDGHHGEWLIPPEHFADVARRYWNAGFKIHVHCTGDLGLELALDTLETLQWERPRFNHGYTIEHFGFSTPEQVGRMAGLGASVSANVYYVHELSHIYAQRGIGVERASQMARLGACFRAGIRTAVHSDFTMAPARPLNSAWVAATRQNCEGNVMGENEILTVEEALATITINAAYMIGLENEAGSLRAGKRADFAVLDQDPFTVGAAGLKDIGIQATVFEGTVYPLEGS